MDVFDKNYHIRRPCNFFLPWFTISITDYTQSGNCYFLAYISIMMEKSAQPGKDGGARPPPITISTITYKIVVFTPAERADTLPLYLL
jgi:hypothetical protein